MNSDQPTLLGILIGGGILGAIIGSLVGFALTQIQAMRATKARNKTLRLLIHLEVEYNFNVLRQLWKTFEERNIAPVNVDQNTLVNIFKESLLMPFSYEAFTSQLASLPGALENGKISQLFAIYKLLEYIEAFQHDLKQANTFDLQYLIRLWVDLSSRIQATLALGNPMPRDGIHISDLPT